MNELVGRLVLKNADVPLAFLCVCLAKKQARKRNGGAVAHRGVEGTRRLERRRRGDAKVGMQANAVLWMLDAEAACNNATPVACVGAGEEEETEIINFEEVEKRWRGEAMSRRRCL